MTEENNDNKIDEEENENEELENDNEEDEEDEEQDESIYEEDSKKLLKKDIASLLMSLVVASTTAFSFLYIGSKEIDKRLTKTEKNLDDLENDIKKSQKNEDRMMDDIEANLDEMERRRALQEYYNYYAWLSNEILEDQVRNSNRIREEYNKERQSKLNEKNSFATDAKPKKINKNTKTVKINNNDNKEVVSGSSIAVTGSAIISKEKFADKIINKMANEKTKDIPKKHILK